MRTLRDTARELKIDERTLRRMLHTAGITPQADPADARKKMLSDEDVAMLRRMKADEEATRVPAWAEDLMRRMQTLEDRIQRIEQRLGLYDEG